MDNIIGVGTDIVETNRVKELIEKKPEFLDRVFTQTEIDYCKSKKNKYQHFAVRFAGKEAVVKALSLKETALKDIAITNQTDGKPHASVKNKNDIAIHLSLSHSKDYAVAYAVAIKKQSNTN